MQSSGIIKPVGIKQLIPTYINIIINGNYTRYQSNFRQLMYLQSDDTRCCVNTILPPEDGKIMLETCRRL